MLSRENVASIRHTINVYQALSKNHASYRLAREAGIVGKGQPAQTRRHAWQHWEGTALAQEYLLQGVLKREAKKKGIDILDPKIDSLVALLDLEG